MTDRVDTPAISERERERTRRVIRRMVKGVYRDDWHKAYNLNSEDWDECARRMLVGMLSPDFAMPDDGSTPAIREHDPVHGIYDPEWRDDEGRMLYRSYALINFFARSDEEAEALIERATQALNRLGNERRGEAVDAMLDDEVYKGEGDEPYVFVVDRDV